MKTVLIIIGCVLCVGVLFTACPSPETADKESTPKPETPKPETPKPVTPKQAAAGSVHTVAMDANGTLYTWGKNSDGQLGTGDTESKLTPTKVTNPPGVTTWKRVAAGWFHTMAIAQDDTLYAWGLNGNGQLGTGDTENKLTPTKVVSPLGVTKWNRIAAGNEHTMAIAQDGTLYAWGLNRYKQLGTGDTENKLTPTKVANPSGVTAWKLVSGGGAHTMAIAQDGTLYAWGLNRYKQLGTGDTENKLTPTKVTSPTGVTTWKQVAAGASYTVAIDANGMLYAWGYNWLGGLFGTGDPRLIGEAGKTWRQVVAGKQYIVTIDTDGVLYEWGRGYAYTPTPINEKDKTWKRVAVGWLHAVAIDQDDVLYTWGKNKDGQLGTGNTKNISTPTRISLE